MKRLPPPLKKRGRPPKSALPTNEETLPPSEEAPPLPKKRGRQPNSATAVATSSKRGRSPSNQATKASEDNQPPIKKPKGNDAGINATSPSPASPSSGKNHPKSMLRTLPERYRDPHPGIIARKPTRRTSAQVAADKKREEELKRSLAELAKRKVEILAEIEVQQQINDEEEAQVINTLADMEGLETAGESWSGDTDIEGSDSKVDEASRSEIEVETRAPKQKVVRKKKPGKGETRAAVDAAKAEIKEKKRKSSVDLGESNASKKSKTAAFPSGLVANWKQKTAGARKPPKATAAASSSVEQTLSGLDDEDADAVRPDFELSGKSRNQDRKNDYIDIASGTESDSDGEDVRDSKKTKSKVRPKPIIRRVAVVAPRGSTATSTSSGTSKGKAPAKLTKVKSEAPVKMESTIPLLLTLSNNSESDGLPDFAKAAAPKPFELYAKGSNLVATVQEVVDIVYPGSGYQVKLNDKIFTMARDRLNEKRSYFGREAAKVVKEFFKGDKYAGNRKAIAKYARWATRDNGPGIFGKPAPMDRGKDIFESKFIIDIVSPFLKWCENSSKNYGRPIGALALAAAAVERAFKMYHSGERKDVGQFSREKVGDMIDVYIVPASNLSDRRWTTILEMCGAHDDESDDEYAGPSALSMQNSRRALYTPSSPTKED